MLVLKLYLLRLKSNVSPCLMFKSMLNFICPNKKSLTNQLSSLVHFTSFYRFTKKSTAEPPRKGLAVGMAAMMCVSLER
jgi:hypothetical protein